MTRSAYPSPNPRLAALPFSPPAISRSTESPAILPVFPATSAAAKDAAPSVSAANTRAFFQPFRRIPSITPHNNPPPPTATTTRSGSSICAGTFVHQTPMTFPQQGIVKRRHVDRPPFSGLRQSIGMRLIPHTAIHFHLSPQCADPCLHERACRFRHDHLHLPAEVHRRIGQRITGISRRKTQ